MSTKTVDDIEDQDWLDMMDAQYPGFRGRLKFLSNHLVQYEDEYLNRREAKELGQLIHEKLGVVVNAIAGSGLQIVGRKLTPADERDCRRCPMCRDTRTVQDPEQPNIYTCRHCNWSGDLMEFRRPPLFPR